jgi:tetratricopeptide (TPR) repeat protein
MKASADSLAGSSEGQIDFAEFALSLFEPFAGMFEPTRATDSQTARFARLLENYCESNEVDVAMIPSGPLCASCVLRQLELLQTHGKAATNESALLYRADLHKAAGQKEPALQYYRRCAELNPLNVRALNEAGILLCEGGQLREGMEYFHRVLRIEPKQAEAQVNLATAYYNSGNPVLAEFHFKEALRINPSLQEAIEGIRILQRRQRR